jgi:hypothetical protein
VQRLVKANFFFWRTCVCMCFIKREQSFTELQTKERRKQQQQLAELREKAQAGSYTKLKNRALLNEFRQQGEACSNPLSALVVNSCGQLGCLHHGVVEDSAVAPLPKHPAG